MSSTELDPEEAMFLSVIYSFHAAAMQQMGKIANPFTGEIERNLAAARGAIDTLMVLQKRTEGNLTDLEERTLNGLLQELQLNYVDEAKRGEEAPAPAEPTEPSEEPVPAEAPGAAEPEEAASETTEEAPEGVDVAWMKKEEEEEKPGEPEARDKPEKKPKKKKSKKKKE
ncbi:MAG: DUF1844 domain-containing protein [Candidatus Coatesbacteria bacterium]|nr:MAG: DUF1844 domain-containing protein [Candidatus Coatesbacteria bacterium]